MNILIAPALGVFGLIAAFVVFSLVMRYSDGTDQVKKIGDEIHKGAIKFMKTEYTYLLIFVAVLVLLVATFLTIQSAIAVVVGAACSSLAATGESPSKGLLFSSLLSAFPISISGKTCGSSVSFAVCTGAGFAT